ncbi:hypothetical protein CO660_24905 [Rhizobium sp. L9]|uniref:HNH endonuclease n=1 Tax=Rhizobium fabae TaxID=573179 RepID=A0A7W6BD51_9HYPH|nr:MULTISPECIES: hypothetical protein [Rhizobium]MBB3917979.1 hypothetical protein [Rhizobium fabae]PDT27068.1 hypothetical protein CO660_24905 [Rhizobium sp. L9]
MPKQCIICDKVAGSREHIFPAALGGRRTNKQIYCGPHNNGFGPLASIIAQQLKPINALLAVRPDRADKAEPFVYETETGEQLRLFAGSVQRTDGASSQNGAMRIQLALGGPEGLRAIAYIALTFFAHYFQDFARLSQLALVKDFVLGAEPNNYVWWESAEATEKLPANPFNFGHTIQLITNGETQEAAAVVSLFQALTFGVALGTLVDMPSRTVTVFIDPHADHPPDDIYVETAEEVAAILRKPEPLQAHLHQTIFGGQGQVALSSLFQKIERWKFDRDMEPIKHRIAAVSLDHGKLTAEVEQIVGEEAGRVLRLARYVVDDLSAREGDKAHMKPVIALLEAQIAEDKSRQSGLSVLAEGAIGLAAIELVLALVEELKTTPVDLDLLWKYFSSGHGAWVVGRALFRPLSEALKLQIP